MDVSGIRPGKGLGAILMMLCVALLVLSVTCCENEGIVVKDVMYLPKNYFFTAAAKKPAK